MMMMMTLNNLTVCKQRIGLVCFYSISTIVSYLMSTPLYTYCDVVCYREGKGKFNILISLALNNR